MTGRRGACTGVIFDGFTLKRGQKCPKIALFWPYVEGKRRHFWCKKGVFFPLAVIRGVIFGPHNLAQLRFL